MEGKENNDGKKKVRTANDVLYIRNADRGIRSRGAINTRLYGRGMGSGTDATN